MKVENMDEQKAGFVLLVESEESLRRVIIASLERLGLQVKEADNPSTALRIINAMRLELLIVELDFPEGHNCKLIEAFRNHNRNHPNAVVVTTVQRPGGEWRREYRPSAIIYKPFDIRHLCKIVTSIIEQENKVEEEMSILHRE
jgi:DNA-binding NtrC family response regulator